MRRTLDRAAVVALVLAALACSAPEAQGRAPSTDGAPPSQQAPVIDHLVPSRDSVGPAPARFEWTPVKGAESYVIGIWNEVDRLIWQQANIHETFIVRPADVVLEPGTYFWNVIALRGGQRMADSGLAAFVVKE